MGTTHFPFKIKKKRKKNTHLLHSYPSSHLCKIENPPKSYFPLQFTSRNRSHWKERQENSHIKQVFLTVPVPDNPTLLVVTFWMWTLGAVACTLPSFLNQFFWYCRKSLLITRNLCLDCSDTARPPHGNNDYANGVLQGVELGI